MVGRLTPEAVLRLARGETHLVPGEHGAPYRSLRLNKADMAAFEEARKKGFLVWRSPQDNLYEIYWRWCNAVPWPFLAAKLRGRSAFIELELCDFETELSDEGVQAIHRVLWGRPLEDIHYLHRRTICAAGLPAQDAERMVAEIHRIARRNIGPRKA